MNSRHNHRSVIAAVGAPWFLNIAVVAKAVHYARAAQIDERNSFLLPSAALMMDAPVIFATGILDRTTKGCAAAVAAFGAGLATVTRKVPSCAMSDARIVAVSSVLLT